MYRLNQFFKKYWLIILVIIGLMLVVTFIVNKNKEINSSRAKIVYLEHKVSYLEKEKEAMEIKLENCKSEKDSY